MMINHKLIKEMMNIEGLEALLILNNRGEVVYQKKMVNSLPDELISSPSLVVYSVTDSQIEKKYSRIRIIFLEGDNRKIILSHFPQQDIYIAVIGSKILMNGSVKLYFDKINITKTNEAAKKIKN